MKNQMLFLALSCSACATIGFATQFCFVCKTDTSSEAYRTSNKDTLSSAANWPTAPEAWYARLAFDQTIVLSALARIMPV